MEYEGNPISLGNTDVKIKNLMRNVNAREDEIRALKSRLEETERALAAAKERLRELGRKRAYKPRGKTQERKGFKPPVPG